MCEKYGILAELFRGIMEIMGFRVQGIDTYRYYWGHIVIMKKKMRVLVVVSI